MRAARGTLIARFAHTIRGKVRHVVFERFSEWGFALGQHSAAVAGAAPGSSQRVVGWLLLGSLHAVFTGVSVKIGHQATHSRHGYASQIYLYEECEQEVD